MKIFRFSFIIPTALIVLLISIFSIFYMDIYLKKAFISAGESVFGAKVEIAELKTKLKGMSIHISGLKIGDKDQEFKNLVDIDSIRFGVRFIPLLSKKLIIDRMNIDGIKWGTKRTTSAKLPPKKKKKRKPGEQSFSEKLIKNAKIKANEEFNAFPSVQKFNEIQELVKNFSPQSVIDASGLQSVTAVQNYYINLMGKYDLYNKNISSIDIKTQVDEVSVLIDKISKTDIKTPADIKALNENLAELDKKRKGLEQTYKELQDIKNNITQDVKEQQNAFKDMKSLIDKDVDNISSKLSIPSFDFKNICKMLFGDIWINRVEKTIYYMQIIRKFLPETEENQIEVRERMKGRDIIFPVKTVLPSLLISDISLSGTTGGEGKTNIPITFKGKANNISSNQKLVGKPLTFSAEGDDTNQKIKVSGIFNRLTSTAEDTVTFAMEGINADRLGIPKTDYTPAFDKAELDFKTEFKLKGKNDFIAKGEIKINDIYYSSEDKNFEGVNKEIIKYVSMLWDGINSINIEAEVFILEEGFRSSFTSDIDKALAQRFDNIIKTSIGNVKLRIRKEINQYVDAQKKVLQTEADKYKQQVQKELEPKMKEVNAKIDEIKKEAEKKQAELKKQAVSSLFKL